MIDPGRIIEDVGGGLQLAGASLVFAEFFSLRWRRLVRRYQAWRRRRPGDVELEAGLSFNGELTMLHRVAGDGMERYRSAEGDAAIQKARTDFREEIDRVWRDLATERRIVKFAAALILIGIFLATWGDKVADWLRVS